MKTPTRARPNFPHLFAALTLTLILGSWAQAGSVEVLELDGRSAYSSLALSGLAGGKHTLETYRGQVVVVNFWASWCPPCLAEFPSFGRLAQRMKGKPVKLLAVNVGEPIHRVKRFSPLLDNAIDILMDYSGKEAKAWGARYFPTTFIVDRQGRLVRRIRGEMDWDSDEAIGWIDALLTRSGPIRTKAL